MDFWDVIGYGFHECNQVRSLSENNPVYLKDKVIRPITGEYCLNCLHLFGEIFHAFLVIPILFSDKKFKTH